MSPAASGPLPQASPASEALLQLRGFGVAFGERVVLSSVTLDVPPRGITMLMGPGGAGKSTLLRTLAGFNDGNPSLRTWGEALYAGCALGAGGHLAPALVAQSARLLMASVLENVVHGLPNRAALTPLAQRELARELLADSGLGALADRLDDRVVRLPLATQRRLAIMRSVLSAPALLCVDEPTAGLDEEEAEALLDYLAREGERRALLVVLHNQRHARRLDGTALLLAGGVIQEARPAQEFFETPQSRAARAFVRSGSCAVPSPDADPQSLDAAAEPPRPPPAHVRHAADRASGPRGFLWLIRGKLAGTPRPGIVRDLDEDLEALRRVGITVLISLTRTPPDTAALQAYGIGNLWSPIPDMGAPSIDQAQWLCRQIEELIARGESVAVHCRAGLGRTGTVLAAFLIWQGREALEALEAVRRVEPKWVQSEEQVAFLEEFARVVSNRAAERRAAAPYGSPIASA